MKHRSFTNFSSPFFRDSIRRFWSTLCGAPCLNIRTVIEQRSTRWKFCQRSEAIRNALIPSLSPVTYPFLSSRTNASTKGKIGLARFCLALPYLDDSFNHIRRSQSYRRRPLTPSSPSPSTRPRN